MISKRATKVFIWKNFVFDAYCVNWIKSIDFTDSIEQRKPNIQRETMKKNRSKSRMETKNIKLSIVVKPNQLFVVKDVFYFELRFVFLICQFQRTRNKMILFLLFIKITFCISCQFRCCFVSIDCLFVLCNYKNYYYDCKFCFRCVADKRLIRLSQFDVATSIGNQTFLFVRLFLYVRPEMCFCVIIWFAQQHWWNSFAKIQRIRWSTSK